MTILVAVGEKSTSERLIETAHELATAYGDDLEVLHVIPGDEAEAHFESLRSIPEFGDMSLSVEEERAEEVAQRLADDALGSHDRDEVRAVGRIGDPAEAILSVAEGNDVRFVVVGGRKRSPAGKALVGSVTQSVLLNSDVPTVTLMEAS